MFVIIYIELRQTLRRLRKREFEQNECKNADETKSAQ